MASFNLVARLMKWIILVDVVLCVLLYLPDQIREFYRITITTSLSGGVVRGSADLNRGGEATG